jgi:hypothetical protein
LLDHDDQGEAAKVKLTRELLVDEQLIIQPRNASTIEDLFSPEDFRDLIRSLDPSLTVEAGELPSKAIRRQKIDKALLARKYAERVSAGQMALTKKSRDAIESLLEDITKAWSRLGRGITKKNISQH